MATRSPTLYSCNEVVCDRFDYRTEVAIGVDGPIVSRFVGLEPDVKQLAPVNDCLYCSSRNSLEIDCVSSVIASMRSINSEIRLSSCVLVIRI